MDEKVPNLLKDSVDNEKLKNNSIEKQSSFDTYFVGKSESGKWLMHRFGAFRTMEEASAAAIRAIKTDVGVRTRIDKYLPPGFIERLENGDKLSIESTIIEKEGEEKEVFFISVVDQDETKPLDSSENITKH